MLDAEAVARLMERGMIEVAPLAFMRGRTLNDSFIILDEAQNTTPEQMKMFLTRLGFGSKVVVTGDVTQIDLPEGRGRSGLQAVRKILDGIDGLAFVELGARDVVRHRIVQDIVNAYERASEVTVPPAGGPRRDLGRGASQRLRRAVRRRRRRRALGPPRPARAPRGAGRPATPSSASSSSTRQTITDLNGRFLDGDGPTDVLAFPIDEDVVLGGRDPDEGGRGPGCPGRRQRAADRARRRRRLPHGRGAHRPRTTDATLDDELALLVVHGVLHLLEYDHADPRSTRRCSAETGAARPLRGGRPRDRTEPGPPPPWLPLDIGSTMNGADARPRRRRLLFLFSILLAFAEMAFTRMSRIRALALEEEGRRARRGWPRCSSDPSRPSTRCCCSCSSPS